MNKEKQIEEMADEIYETLMLEAECPLSGMDCAIIADLLVGKGYRKISDDHQRQCTCYALGCQMAEELKEKVAREIFEEIEKNLNRKTARSKPRFEKLHRDEKDLSIWGYKDMGYFQGIIATCEDLQDLIAELKKKYTEGGE